VSQEILLIFFLVLLNGVFAGTEMALVSTKKGRLELLAKNGSRGAAAALRLQEHPTRLLSTVQVGITFVGTVAGVFGGASIADKLAPFLANLPLPGLSPETVALAIVVGLISYLSLVFGELVPKKLALHYPERLATFMARPMETLAFLSRPLVLFLSGSTEGVLALLGQRGVKTSSVTAEDIRMLAQEGAEGGTVEQHEQEIINRVFHLSDRNARQVMTPRTRVYSLRFEDTVGAVLDEALRAGFSRFPVIEQDLDHVVGVVHVRELVRLSRDQGENALVREAMRPPLFVPDSTDASRLLANFRRTQQHMAVVVDEIGAVEGIVTLEDVLEELVGEIADEHDESPEQSIVARDDGSYLVDGSLALTDLHNAVGLGELPPERSMRFDTVAGFVLMRLGRIPRTGESAVWDRWRFEVVDMDGLRIDKVLLSPLPAPDSD
jgi:putative hemolysin